jgi:hypothetical protein
MRKMTKNMTIAAAVASTLAFAAPAFAAGVALTGNGDSKLKVEGLFYLNTFAESKDSTTLPTTKTKTFGLNTQRAYITIKYIFNDNWYARFTTDMAGESTLGHKQNVYVKYAYLDGKLAGKQAVLRIGQSHTPWIDHEESLMKYRFIENTMVDKANFDSSADLGLGLYGDLADNMVSYFVTETNGHGYGNGSPSNAMDFDGRITIRPIKGLELDGQFRDGYRGTKTSTVAGIKSTFYQVMLAYGMDNFRIGANYLNNKDDAKATGVAWTNHNGNLGSGFLTGTSVAGQQVKSTGWDVWGWYDVPGTDFGLFGRYENQENKANFLAAGTLYKEKVQHYVAAAAYRPTKGVTLALALDNTEVKDFGGLSGHTVKDARYGLYTQVAF